jgi:hypothetical protein
MDVLNIAVPLLVVMLVLGALAYAVKQIVRAPELNQTEKIVWVLAVVFFPVVGTLVWFFAGPHPFGLRINRELR